MTTQTLTSAEKCMECSHRPSCALQGATGFRCCYSCKHLNYLKQCTVPSAGNKREINTPGKNVVCDLWELDGGV